MKHLQTSHLVPLKWNFFVQHRGLDKAIFFIALVLASTLYACQPQRLSQDSKYGTLYFPLSDGRLAFMSADCLIEDLECPKPRSTVSSVKANEWTRLSWSPDGTKAIVLIQNRSDWIGMEKDELLLLDSQFYSLSSLIRMSYIDDVSWSPDGKWLAVAGVKEGRNASTTDTQIALSAIFVISSDGKSIQNLTDGLHGMKHHLSWLNKITILFEVDDYPNSCGTYSLDISQKTWVSLLGREDCSVFPQPSPDGNLIAYGSVKPENSSLLVMNSDGTSKTLLAKFDALGVLPLWSPNQEWIRLDTIDKKVNSSIFVISPNGSKLQNVYRSERLAYGTWAPIEESYLLVNERDGKGFVSKWFSIQIPDGATRPLSIFDDNDLPRWVSWRPPLVTISNP